uniref:ATP-binding protein n=1 Tax=uncultured marine group II/III euryarchaeote KM3_92_B07 TaxID=1456543 RepID=A0A075HWI5_9EURY|nr:hypothetical protein [uncultured marine group II/III euryarchaeote KM3_92_B07]
MEDERREQFVLDHDFLNSARSSDLQFDDGVWELIDNAIDAGAKQIFVEIRIMPNDINRLIVMDDGHGIPTWITDPFEPDSEPRPGIPFVLAYGGRSHGDKKRNDRIGRFGIGLSNTACCLTGHTNIWSKTADDAKWRYGYYDFDELMESEDCTMEPEVEVDSTGELIPSNLEHGTIVLMDINRDTIRYSGSAVDRISKLVGRVYRRWLADPEHRLVIKNVPLKAKEQFMKVLPRDPLHLIENSFEVQETVQGIVVGEDEIVLTSEHPLWPEEASEEGFDEAWIRMKVVRIPQAEWRRSVGLPPSTGTGGAAVFNKEEETQFRKWGITGETQGFSLLRNGREIGCWLNLGLFNNHHKFTYFRGEVDFHPALDNLFGIENNKSRSSVPQEVVDLLKPMWIPLQSAYMTQRKEEAELYKKFRIEQRQNKQAEAIARQASDFLPQPAFNEDDLAKSEKYRRKERERRKKEIRERIAAKSGPIAARKEAAEAAGDAAAVRAAQDQLSQLEQQQADLEADIEYRFRGHSPVRFIEEPLESKEIYRQTDRGTESEVTIANDTLFFDEIYRQTEDKEHLRIPLDLVFGSLGLAEFYLTREAPDMERAQIKWERW